MHPLTDIPLDRAPVEWSLVTPLYIQERIHPILLELATEDVNDCDHRLINRVVGLLLDRSRKSEVIWQVSRSINGDATEFVQEFWQQLPRSSASRSYGDSSTSMADLRRQLRKQTDTTQQVRWSVVTPAYIRRHLHNTIMDLVAEYTLQRDREMTAYIEHLLMRRYNQRVFAMHLEALMNSRADDFTFRLWNELPSLQEISH